MTLQEALDWVNAKGEEFGKSHTRILRGRERAAAFARTLPRGSEARQQAGATVARWSKLLDDQQRAMVRWQQVASRVPGLDGSLGLVPVIPVAIAGTVIAVAVSMALVLRRVTSEERALALLESGRITPAEAIELAANLEGGRPSLAGFGAFPVLIVAAMAGIYFLRPR